MFGLWWVCTQGSLSPSWDEHTSCVSNRQSVPRGAFSGRHPSLTRGSALRDSPVLFSSSLQFPQNISQLNRGITQGPWSTKEHRVQNETMEQATGLCAGMLLGFPLTRHLSLGGWWLQNNGPEGLEMLGKVLCQCGKEKHPARANQDSTLAHEGRAVSQDLGSACCRVPATSSPEGCGDSWDLPRALPSYALPLLTTHWSWKQHFHSRSTTPRQPHTSEMKKSSYSNSYLLTGPSVTIVMYSPVSNSPLRSLTKIIQDLVAFVRSYREEHSIYSSNNWGSFP